MISSVAGSEINSRYINYSSLSGYPGLALEFLLALPATTNAFAHFNSLSIALPFVGPLWVCVC